MRSSGDIERNAFLENPRPKIRRQRLDLEQIDLDTEATLQFAPKNTIPATIESLDDEIDVGMSAEMASGKRADEPSMAKYSVFLGTLQI